uniref:Glutaredoxin domain-containing protein n=1 Tax=Zooxanthella nutricula TaxID=1333877 RepID=A0A7S2PCK2_9DINO
MDVRTFRNGRIQAQAAAVRKVGPRGGEADKENQSVNVPAAPSLEALTSSQPFVVVSLDGCGQCEELKALLTARGVPAAAFVKWNKGGAEYPALKKQLAAHAGEVFTFPQVFADSKYQGGFKEVAGKVEQGAYDELFEREFGAEPSTLKRWIDRRPMVVFSLPSCPNCDVLRADLVRRGVPADDVFIKLDKAKPEYPSMKAQLQKLIGRDAFAFPQTFVRTAYQGNFDEVIAKADAGDYADFFAEQFGVKPPAPAPPDVGAAFALDEDF